MDDKNIHSTQNKESHYAKTNDSVSGSPPIKRSNRRQTPLSAEFVPTTDEEDYNEQDEGEQEKSTRRTSKRRVPVSQTHDTNSISSKTRKSNERDQIKHDDGEPPDTDEQPELVTVNMEDLTDLLYTATTSNKTSKGKNSHKQDRQIFFARKSEPNKTSNTRSLKQKISTQEQGRCRRKQERRIDANDDLPDLENDGNEMDGISSYEPINGPGEKQGNHGGGRVARKNNEPTVLQVSHQGHKFYCHLCDKAFKIKTNLQLHLEKVCKI